MNNQGITTLIRYGGAHAAVDAACAALLFGWIAAHRSDTSTIAVLVALYNLLAFGLQPLLGMAVDSRRCYRQAAAAGCALTGAAMLVPTPLIVLAIVAAGTGNALFHVGGGGIALRLKPGRAAPAGVFVAPGAAGLFLGTLLGTHGFSSLGAGALVLGVLAVLLLVHEAPAGRLQETAGRRCVRPELILLLLWISVATRSFTSLALSLPSMSPPRLAAILMLAAVLGKGLGGVLADRFGWMRTAAGSLLLSIPFVLCGTASHLERVPAMFLVAATMPVALAAVSRVLPSEPSFAFGLSGAALLVGFLPGLTAARPRISDCGPTLAAVAICGLALCAGLRLARLSGAPQTHDAE